MVKKKKIGYLKSQYSYQCVFVNLQVLSINTLNYYGGEFPNQRL